MATNDHASSETEPPASNEQAVSIERRSLATGKWANLVMAISGVVAAYASHSDALLVDGLYSGVNFISAIVAGQIALSLSRPADRRYPFGYDAYEALYVKYRSLVLLGIMTFAIFGALSKIATYLQGGQVPELVFGPILIYMFAMIAVCAGLAVWHYHNWRRTGGRSEILRTESRAAVIDGVISAGAGGGLFAATLLKGTFLAGLIPIADSIVVLILCLIVIRQPVQMFLGSLRELAGGAADSQLVDQATRKTREILAPRPIAVRRVAVTKLGRTHFVVPYLVPDGVVTAHEIDLLREELEQAYANLLGPTKAEVIITAEKE